MRTLISCCLFAASVAAGSSAIAQESSSSGRTGVGVGAEATITGVGGAAVVYDADAFRIDGILSFENAGDDTLALGGRFLYVLHDGVRSDFAIGGGLALVHLDRENPNDDDETDVHLELIAQLRAFITPNVALSGSFGAGTVVTDGEDLLLIDGQLVGAVGATYFFW